MLKTYDQFAKFYDEVMGNEKTITSELNFILETHKPEFYSLLDLACGTGTILKNISEKFGSEKNTGVDISEKMILTAKKKIPKANFYQQNIVNFKIKEKFDVITCLFDSINHIIKLSDWEKIFSNTKKHLNEGGVFIFDINTIEQLEKKIIEPTWVKKFNDNFMLMKVKKDNKIYNWEIKIFEKLKSNYKLHSITIPEVSFEINEITKILKKHFSEIKIHKSLSANGKSERVYFICNK